MPEDSPRSDLYDGLREFLVSATRKEIRDEKLPEPDPYEMGLKISRGVCSEAAEEACFRSAAQAIGERFFTNWLRTRKRKSSKGT